MSLADALGLGRALAAIPIVIAITLGNEPLALVTFALAALTDAIDGPLARRAGPPTARGAFIDPLADKILVVGTLTGLAIAGGVAGWLVALVAARETAVASARAVTLSRGIRLSAGGLAKLKTLAEMSGVVLLLAGGPLTAVGTGLLVVALAAGLATLPRYLPGRAPRRA